MSYPKIVISTGIVKNNVKILVGLCKKYGINVAGVTKGVCANEKIVRSFVEGGVKYLADSRIKNLKRLKPFKLPKIMIRLPMISEIPLVIKYSDISLNSELKTIVALSKEAIKQCKTHKIILMIDVGDLREGIFYKEDLDYIISNIIQLKGIKLVGIGTNLTCFGGVIPEKHTIKKLTDLGKLIENKYNIKLGIISGGNSSSIHLLSVDALKGINNLRLGESLLLGKESAYGKQIKGTSSTGFCLEAEIIEIKYKPSVPIGKIGKNAFGETPTFKDRGIRKRIICGVGRQDVKIESLIPLDHKLIILGGSSDHLVIDGDDSDIDYKVGDIIKFNLGYGGILSSMTSEYVDKAIID